MTCLRNAILLLLIFLAASFAAKATHIVGGEVTYKWITGNTYRIRLDIYQDCLNGEPDALRQDNPAYIAIFTGNGTRVITDSIPASSILTVPANFSNDCINNPPRLCLNRETFINNYNLPPNSNGYYVVYQRCCRNTIVNINDAQSIGATNYAFIPPRSGGESGNSSAVFKNYPPQIICINNPLVYDHSATDADGDSLTYEFCTAYEGGNPNDAKPVPQSINFVPVPYSFGYSAINPMNGMPALQIDRKTGLITGTPTMQGRFVVTVCCHEWRKGIMISTVTREFQFVVTNCSKAVVANIPQFSDEFNTYIVQCKGKTVQFVNNSTGANSNPDAYSWDFGVPYLTSDTSHLKDPSYTYPDTGVYRVKLVINRGSTCMDSISRLVKVYPEFHAGFDVQGLHCPKEPIQFINTSASTYQPIVSYLWSFGDSSTSTIESPTHSYSAGGKYFVTLASRNVKGCVDTALHEVDVEQFVPFAGNDTIIVKGEYIFFHASGGSVYTWTPSTYLNNPDIRNPIGYYPDTMRINYVVHIASESGCEGYDTVNVWVVNQSALFVPSAFSPNGDGRNDILRPIGIGYGNVNYFRVFNRWGQQVFYGTKFNDGWDGSYQGARADIGTYYWELSVTDRFGQEQKLKGDAALIR
jgi:gliding motility-associated-like protein